MVLHLKCPQDQLTLKKPLCPTTKLLQDSTPCSPHCKSGHGCLGQHSELICWMIWGHLKVLNMVLHPRCPQDQLTLKKLSCGTTKLWRDLTQCFPHCKSGHGCLVQHSELLFWMIWGQWKVLNMVLHPRCPHDQLTLKKPSCPTTKLWQDLTPCSPHCKSGHGCLVQHGELLFFGRFGTHSRC